MLPTGSSGAELTLGKGFGKLGRNPSFAEVGLVGHDREAVRSDKFVETGSFASADVEPRRGGPTLMIDGSDLVLDGFDFVLGGFDLVLGDFDSVLGF